MSARAHLPRRWCGQTLERELANLEQHQLTKPQTAKVAHTHTCAHMQTAKVAHTHTCAHMQTTKITHTHTCAHMQTTKVTHTHTCTHMQTTGLTYTHMHTHTGIGVPMPTWSRYGMVRRAYTADRRLTTCDLDSPRFHTAAKVVVLSRGMERGCWCSSTRHASGWGGGVRVVLFQETPSARKLASSIGG